MIEYITYDLLIPLGSNISTAFKILHPEGLSIKELKEKTKERNFYQGIYKYIKEARR